MEEPKIYKLAGLIGVVFFKENLTKINLSSYKWNKNKKWWSINEEG